MFNKEVACSKYFIIEAVNGLEPWIILGDHLEDTMHETPPQSEPFALHTWINDLKAGRRPSIRRSSATISKNDGNASSDPSTRLVKNIDVQR